MTYQGTVLPRNAASPRPSPASRRPRGPLAAIEALLARWAAADADRRNLEALRSMPDHLLKDIGLTRDDLRHAALRSRWR